MKGKRYTTIGLSLNIDTAKQIDTLRGKISRSLFLREVIDKGLAVEGAVDRVK
jgi:hypothetical protein